MASFSHILLKENVIESNVKLECVPKFPPSSKGQSEMCLGKV